MGKTLWDRTAVVLVSLAFALDWLPAYVTGLPSSMVTLTRWVAVPLMLISMVIEPDAYLPVIARPQAIALAFAAVVGMGGGVAAGTIPRSVLVSFMPSLLTVVFYARRRDSRSLTAALTSLLIGSWVLCAVVVLAGLNLVPGRTVLASQVIEGVYERTWAGVSSSLLGPWVAILIGSLGGFALRPAAFRMTVLAGASISVGVLVVVITAQRSILLVAILSFLASAISTLSVVRRQRTGTHAQRHLGRNVVVVVLSIVLLLALLWPMLRERSFTLLYRLSALQATADYYGGALRLAMWRYLAQDLVGRPQLIAPGDKGMFTALSVGPHLMLGESYYYGGLLMLVAMLMLMISLVRSVFRAVRWPASSEWAIVAGIIVSVLVPTLVYLTIMPGFVSRLPYVLMGMALALPSAPTPARLRARNQAIPPRNRVPTTCTPDSH